MIPYTLFDIYHLVWMQFTHDIVNSENTEKLEKNEAVQVKTRTQIIEFRTSEKAVTGKTVLE